MKRSFLATTAMLLLATACSESSSRLLTAPGTRPSRVIVATSPTGATVNTDQEDYAPGQVVTILGKGWASGEVVHINLTESPVADGPHDWDVTADANGAFADTSFTPGLQHLGVTFTLTATGETSGIATAQFKDGATVLSILAISPTTPNPGASFDVNISVAINGSGANRTWKATGWSIDSGALTCVNTADILSVNGTYPLTITGPTAPATSGPDTLHVTAFEDDACTNPTGGVKSLGFVVASVANTAPAVDAGADATINEGSTFSQSGSFTDPDANAWTATVDYGDGSGVQALALSGKTFALSHQYVDNGSYTVTVTVNDGTANGSDQVSVTVNNVSPTATFGNNGPVNEGSSFQLSLTSPVDPSSADVAAGLHYAFDCGDGGGYGTALTYATSSTASTKQCSTTDNGTRSVKAKIFDKDGGSTEYTGSVTVNNVPPTATFGNDGSVNEGSPFDLSLTSPVDPSSADVAAGFRYAFDCGDGSGYGTALTYATSGTTGTKQCSTEDNGTRNVKAKIFDKDGGSTEYTGTVTVNNVAPSITSISVVPALLAVNNTVNGSAPFTDPGTADSHTATWDWGDGSTSAGTVSESHGSGTATGSHMYTAAGVYTVTATVSDDDGGSGTKIYQYVVVYDPSAGFVTGGGWINSPAGACSLSDVCAGAVGKANFGFVSKYQKGANTPTGNTEFQFQAGNLNFKSTAYDWLVISGARAQYKGTGTVNGQSGYQFILTATDGDISGGGGADRFRIKIADASGNVVYDNMGNLSGTLDSDVNSSIDSNSATLLGGGSINIKSK